MTVADEFTMYPLSLSMNFSRPSVNLWIYGSRQETSNLHQTLSGHFLQSPSPSIVSLAICFQESNKVVISFKAPLTTIVRCDGASSIVRFLLDSLVQDCSESSCSPPQAFFCVQSVSSPTKHILSSF